MPAKSFIINIIQRPGDQIPKTEFHQRLRTWITSAGAIWIHGTRPIVLYLSCPEFRIEMAVNVRSMRFAVGYCQLIILVQIRSSLASVVMLHHNTLDDLFLDIVLLPFLKISPAIGRRPAHPPRPA